MFNQSEDYLFNLDIYGVHDGINVNESQSSGILADIVSAWEIDTLFEFILLIIIIVCCILAILYCAGIFRLILVMRAVTVICSCLAKLTDYLLGVTRFRAVYDSLGHTDDQQWTHIIEGNFHEALQTDANDTENLTNLKATEKLSVDDFEEVVNTLHIVESLRVAFFTLNQFLTLVFFHELYLSICLLQVRQSLTWSVIVKSMQSLAIVILISGAEQATFLFSKKQSIFRFLLMFFPLNSTISILVSLAVAYLGICILISACKAGRFKETQGAQSSNEYGFLTLTVVFIMCFQLFKLVLLVSIIAVLIMMKLVINSCEKMDDSDVIAKTSCMQEFSKFYHQGTMYIKETVPYCIEYLTLIVLIVRKKICSASTGSLRNCCEP